MKKSLKTIVACLGLALTFGLTACGSVSQGYADKINKAYATETKDDDLTYEQVLKDLGDPAINITGSFSVIKATGACTWYKGCKTVEDKNKKLEEGKNVDYIIVTFLNGTATGAEFGTLEGNKQ